MKRVGISLAVVLCSGLVMAQGRNGRGGGQRPAAEPAAAAEEGFPVTDPLVIKKCGTCHTKDEKGNLSRISWTRTTPEGWEEAIKRMVRLNGLVITSEEAKPILKYLATNHGLAPEEAKPVMYIPEHRIQDEDVPNEAIRSTCMNCHALGRPFSWHRTKEEWTLLTTLHSALYQQAESAFRGGNRNGGGGGAPAVGSAPAAPAVPVIDQTIDFLTKNYGLHTPEWAAWRTRMRAPKMTGKWMVSAHILGKGKYYGEMTIAPGAADDEFTTTMKLQPVGGGPAITRTGTSVVYAGYSWRGRSKGSAAPASAAPDDLSSEMREAMWISPDQSWGQGRWFWGEYQEFGLDVKIQRATSEPLLVTTDKYSLKTGSKAQRVRLIGNSFPLQVTAADLDFGAGVKVTSIVSHTATQIVAEVDVAADAATGKRDVAVGRSSLQDAIAVYNKIDYIKVLPETALARLGGDAKSVHPKGYQQLEAIAFAKGEDGKIHTGDDIDLGPVDVNWSVEEFLSVFGDDDREFVGSLSSTGLFSPNIDGPNPQRKFSRNNYGDVWVVATAKDEKDKDGKPLVGKSYLVVTVPTYIKWDQPEVTK
ncbi:MAG: quinohemoprotein amine dehydrogenase subunit alpha [Acidobacteriia bacterium]|nr:quinohemoprotein amine dehydrogenase subunit alpha [Terriglobia bacterium]